VVDFDDAAGKDQPNVETVSSTFVFGNVPAGQHTIRWVANKRTTADPNLVVDTSQLSVMCFDTEL
jgi:hypothetical protein